MNNNIKDKIEHTIKVNVMYGCSTKEEFANPFAYLLTRKIIDIIEEEINKKIDIEVKDLAKTNDSVEYWLIQGKILALKEFKESILL